MLNFSFHAENVERLGNSTYLFGSYLDVKDFKVHIPSDEKVSRGDDMLLYVEKTNLHLFDAQGLALRDYEKIK